MTSKSGMEICNIDLINWPNIEFKSPIDLRSSDFERQCQNFLY